MQAGFFGCIISFLLMMILTPLAIKVSGRFSSPIKEELGESQQKKKGVGHYGGIAFFISYLISTFVLNYDTSLFILNLAVILFALIGFIDDALKSRRQLSDGLKSLTKLALQLSASLVITLLMVKDGFVEKNIFYILFIIVYIAYFVNAINITDGLDGLASCVSIPILALIFLTSRRFEYLIFLYALMGFLFFNGGKAKIFMGDTGSHSIGAMIGVGAVLTGNTFTVLFAAVIPFIELMTSFIQIIAIRRFNKRVFLIAPYHHHLEKKGVNEQVIVVRFALVTIFICSVIFFTLNKGGNV